MSIATINEQPILAGAVAMPSHGLWTATLTVASDVELSGQVSIDFDGLALVGTVESGGVFQSTGHYRVVAGMGGWRRSIPALAYQNGAGVKRATSSATPRAQLARRWEHSPMVELARHSCAPRVPL